MPLKRKAVEAEEGDQNRVNWASNTVAELKSELMTRGLPLTGKKADLVARLEADEASESAEVAPIEETGDEEDGEDIDWKYYKVPELREELSSRSLPVNGKKADLIARLEANDKGEAVDSVSASIPSRCTKRSNTRPAPTSVSQTAPAPKAYNNRQAATYLPHPSQAPGRKAATRPPRPSPAANAYPANLLATEFPDIASALARDVIVHKHMNAQTGERRQREFVPAPDYQFLTKIDRIRSERMFMLDRRMSVDRKGNTCQIFDIAGSTGNIYTVTIGRRPNCDCMDAVS